MEPKDYTPIRGLMEPKDYTPIRGLRQPRECTATEMLHEMVNYMACTARILVDEAEDWGDVLDFNDLDTQVLKFKQAIRKACRKSVDIPATPAQSKTPTTGDE